MTDYTPETTDWDLDDEYKEDPLLPIGTYLGVISGAELKAKSAQFTVHIENNGPDKVCSDGETPVDGATLRYNLWLPQQGDESESTPSGRSTKRQYKINAMKKFFSSMQMPINTLGDLKEAIENTTFLGLPVLVEVELDSYQGEVRNNVRRMTLAPSDGE